MGNEDTLSSGLHDRLPKNGISFGKEIAKEFLFNPKYTNINHGSFGTIPRHIQNCLREYQDAYEAEPDIFIRYDYPKALDLSRASVARFINAPVDSVVFVPNATTGINTVLRNLTWNPDGKDEILYFSFIYGACGKTIDYICEVNLDIVSSRCIEVPLPFSNSELIALFKTAIAESRASGHRPRIALFDTIVSLPGIRLPFEALTNVCAEEGIFSLIDGAHGIGQIPLNLSKLNPDFFVSNCHKWLYTPRGCAVFYVPVKHQHLIRSTIPTSHGFTTRGAIEGDRGPLPKSSNSAYVTNFEFVGSIDSSPYLCVEDAIRWREEVCGGERAIMEYCSNLAHAGGQKVADMLRTRVLENDEGTLGRCMMVNVLLPISDDDLNEFEFDIVIKSEERLKIITWMLDKCMDEYKTFLPITPLNDGWWVRLSGQIYLDIDDFEYVGRMLKELCERVKQGEYESRS